MRPHAHKADRLAYDVGSQKLLWPPALVAPVARELIRFDDTVCQGKEKGNGVLGHGTPEISGPGVLVDHHVVTARGPNIDIVEPHRVVGNYFELWSGRFQHRHIDAIGEDRDQPVVLLCLQPLQELA